MKQKAVEVKTGGKVVETISVELFESLEELMTAVKPEDIVAYYNRQKVENERNVARASHQPSKAGKTKKVEMGFAVAFELFHDEFHNAIAQGTEKMMEFVNSEKVQKVVGERLTAAATA